MSSLVREDIDVREDVKTTITPPPPVGNVNFALLDRGARAARTRADVPEIAPSEDTVVRRLRAPYAPAEPAPRTPAKRAAREPAEPAPLTPAKRAVRTLADPLLAPRIPAKRDPRTRVRALIRSSITQNKREMHSLARLVLGAFYLNIVALATLVEMIGGTNAPSAGVAATLVARVAAMVGTYLLLVQLLLVGRLPWLDRLYGMDRLTRWHRTNGHVAFTLILIHVGGVVIGRAMIAHVSVAHMAVVVYHYRYMPEAVAGLGMIFTCIITSIRMARKHMSRERWYSVHLFAYAGVILSFGHEIYGPDFVGHWGAQAYLFSLYIATFAMIMFYRIVLPTYRTFRHQLRVVDVVQENENVTSIYLEGRDLDVLGALAGQFFHWRFLTKADWLETHPYSLSIAPDKTHMRITVKHLGDASLRMATVPIGTWVMFEGPYGGFTVKHRTQVRTLLVAAGVGITPIRSLLEGMESAEGDIVMVYRANSRKDLVLLEEIEALAMERKARIRLVLGGRDKYPADRQPLSPEHLLEIVPDVHRRDIYVCANPGVAELTMRSLEALGVDKQQIHYELFAM